MKKRFTAHDNLLVDVIKRQSGTVGKAILEGVMNSIDANAKRVDITLTPEKLIIADDGRGLLSEEELDEWFAKFGTPHEKDELGEVKGAKFGEFRMGRGQLFAFGINTWQTRSMKMYIDVNTMGLDFEVTTLNPPYDGCRVEVLFYQRLKASTILEVVAEVGRNCKYTDAPVYLNGTKVNTPPPECKWTEITDDAYIKVAAGTQGIDFYQQGVYVQNIPAYLIGASGVIVTKQRVDLNFARNEVMRSDTRFKRIMTKFKKDTETRLKNKVQLTPEEVTSLHGQLRLKAIDWDDHKTSKLFPDTTGRGWSINTLFKLKTNPQFHAQPNKKMGFSFAPAGDLRADRVMQRGLGVVFDEVLLEYTGHTPEKFFDGISYRLQSEMQYMTLDCLSQNASTKHTLVDVNKQTGTETRVLKALEQAMHHFTSTQNDLLGISWRDAPGVRILRVGLSTSARGWTDGVSYVALERNFLLSAGTTLAGFVNICRLLVHEVCHRESDTDTHQHGLEFYRMFHDIIGHRDGLSLGKQASWAFHVYMKLVEHEAQKPTKRQQRTATLEQVHLDNERLLGEKEAEVTTGQTRFTPVPGSLKLQTAAGV